MDDAEGISHCAERSHQHSAQGPGGRAGLRRVEVITGLDRRRRWPPELKAEIIAESFAPGVNVSRLARLHGLSLGLLHQWRRAARDRNDTAPLSFVPVVTTQAPPSERGNGAASQAAGLIEIEVGGAVVRVRGPVDGRALQTVFGALRGGA